LKGLPNAGKLLTVEMPDIFEISNKKAYFNEKLLDPGTQSQFFKTF